MQTRKAIPSDALKIIDWPEKKQDRQSLLPEALEAIDQVATERDCSRERAIICLLSEGLPLKR